MESPATSQRWMSPPRLFQIGVVFLILVTGTWIRTRDLAADPLDVSHSQQLIFLLTAKAYQSPAHADNPALPSGADFASSRRMLLLCNGLMESWQLFYKRT